MRAKTSELRTALLFLAPHLIGFLLFQIFPVFGAIAFSLLDWNLITTPTFIGFENYIELFSGDFFFQRAMLNTVYYTVGTVTIIVVTALIAAVLLNERVHFRSFFRTMYFVPNVSSLVAVSFVWMWIYNSDYGLLNNVLRMLGVQNPPQWLSDVTLAMPSVMVMSAWTQVGFFTVIFLAGLQNIPNQYYESAVIDGSSRIQSFFRITLPLLSPTTFFVLTLAIINSFQVFEQTFIMTRGGPAFSTTTAVMYIYDQAFQYQEIGYASAVSVVLFAAILAVTVVQVILQKRWVHYDL
jgi:multiple sugar transport system permease protein